MPELGDEVEPLAQVDDIHRYLCELPKGAIASTTAYTHSPEQLGNLRDKLKTLLSPDSDGKIVWTLVTILTEAGLNMPGSITYDTTALSRFIGGITTAPSKAVAEKLYIRWVGSSNAIDISKIQNIFYHAVMSITNSVDEQREILRTLPGHYFFYKRSAHNPDFFIKGLLDIRRRQKILHVSELQRHDGSAGIPEAQEIDEGFAFKIGSILYFITRSKALKGATFTVISHYPVRTRAAGVGEEVMGLYGFQIGGRDSTPLTASPFTAERISFEDADKARAGGGAGQDMLGFKEEVPKLLSRHMKNAF